MVERLKNTKVANRIYLAENVLNILFVSYMLLRVFNVLDVSYLRNNNNWMIVIGFIILLNILRVIAKKKGGIGNPLRTMAKAKSIHYAAIAVFFLGVVLVLFLHKDKVWMYISLLAIPLDIYAVYIAHTEQNIVQETDLIDDFDIDED